MTIRVEPNPDNLSIEQIIANMYERMTLSSLPPSLTAHINPMTVAGQQAYKTDIFSDSSAFYIFLQNDDKVYIFALVQRGVNKPTVSCDGSLLGAGEG